MKHRLSAAAALAALLLASAGCAPATQPSPSQSTESQSNTGPTQSTEPEPSLPPAFVHSDSFYTDLGLSLDICMAPLFLQAEDLTPRQQSSYFFFFVDREGLYNHGADWWDERDRVYRIPIADIEAVLQRYLGVEAFDPLEAYGTELLNAAYTPVPLGYYPEEQVYVVYQINGWGGVRRAQLLSKEKLEDGTVRITEGFYDFGEDFDAIKDQPPYKRRVYTLLENADDPNDYRLLSLVDIHNVNGEEIVVSDSESHLNLRQPETLDTADGSSSDGGADSSGDLLAGPPREAPSSAS